MTGYPSIDKPWLKYYSKEACSAPIPSCSAYDHLLTNNQNDLENIALNYFGRLITYRELFKGIDDCTKALSAAGLKDGDVIVMSTVTIPEAIYAFYACNRLGIIVSMVDPRTSVEGIRSYISEAQVKYVISIDVACPKFEAAAYGTDVERIISISPSDSLPALKRLGYIAGNRLKGTSVIIPKTCVTWQKFISRGIGANYDAAPYTKDHCCAIVHTGGTTGTPKGVMLSNENINTMALQYRLLGADFNKEQRFLNIMPPFIAYGIVCGIHMPLVLGLTDVLIPQLKEGEFAHLVKEYKPAHMLGVPAHFEQLLLSKRMSGFDLSFFESAGAGGDGITAQFERDINRFLHDHNCKYEIAKGYGMTEISSAATACHGTVNKFQSAGIPHAKTVVSIFEPGTDRELRYGETGEICMSGPTVMIGYFHHPEATAEILREHSDGMLWLHSGDIGHMDEDGFLFVDGRMKRLIIRHDGFKVFPSAIENVISSHPDVQQCCVVGIKDESKRQGEVPRVFATLNKTAKRSDQIKQELVQLCRETMPEYAQPADWRFLDSLPFTAIGKIDYRALEDMQ